MKITDVKVHMFGATAADGVTRRRNWIFVEVVTDEGINGIGEATTEYHEMAVKAQIETELRPRLLGQDPTDVAVSGPWDSAIFGGVWESFTRAP